MNKWDLASKIYKLEQLWQVRDKQAEEFSRRLKAHAERFDRLVERLGSLEASLRSVEERLAMHSAVEHEGLNETLLEDLIFNLDVNPWDAVRAVRNGKGKG
jgi:superfamily II RNA helicase